MIVRSGLTESFAVSSAATTSEEIGNPVYPPMRRLLEERGLECSEKKARKVKKSDYNIFDLIIGMDEENRWDLRRIFHGDPEGRIHNLLEYLGRGSESIPDPWYTRDFSGCLDVIEKACYALWEQLSGVVFLDFSACADIPSLYSEMRHKMAWADWYGENLDALHDILTGLPHRGSRFILTLPSEDAPPEVRLYADCIASVFQQYEKDIEP